MDGRLEDTGGDRDEGPQYRFLDVPAGRIRYTMRPGGPLTLLLLHGFGADIDSWAFNIDEFEADATVYALDLPGHGHSVKTMPRRPVKGLAASVLDFIDVLGLTAVHVAGHSLGGLVAALLPGLAPGRIASLTLICSAGLGRSIDATFLDDFIAASSREALQPVLERLFSDPRYLSQHMMAETLDYKRVPGVDTALRALRRDLIAQRLQRRIVVKRLRALKLPILAIAGRDDRIVPPRQIRALKYVARLLVVPHAGHLAQMEQHVTVNAAIAAHIRAAGASIR